MNLDDYLKNPRNKRNRIDIKEKQKEENSHYYFPSLEKNYASFFTFMKTHSFIRPSLTQTLKIINPSQTLTNLLSHLKRSLKKLFTQKEIKNCKIVNPYPDWVNQRKLWAHFGVLTDYMIRKMLSLLFPEKIGNLNHTPLIAEQGLFLLRIIEGHTEEGVPIENLLPNVSQDSKVIKDLYQNALKWIKAYKSSESWKDALIPAAKMVNLDIIFREARVYNSFILLGDDFDIRETFPFFENIYRDLGSKFKDAHRIILNPVLGHPYTLKADADLICDDCLIEIKTTKYPTKHLETTPLQLLGYVSLQTFLQYLYNRPNEEIEHLKNRFFPYISVEDKVNHYPSLSSPRIKKIGYYFPLHSRLFLYSIEEWKDDERIELLEMLLKILFEKLKKKPRYRSLF